MVKCGDRDVFGNSAMKVVICGVGQIGLPFLEMLAAQPDISLTVVDNDADRLSVIKGYLDVRTIHGSAVSPDILAEAKVGEADALILTTPSDSLNLLIASLAYHLFNSPLQLVHMDSVQLKNTLQKDLSRQFVLGDEMTVGAENLILPPTTRLISVIDDLVSHISALLQYPSVTNLCRFSSGKISVFSTRIDAHSPFLNRPILHLHGETEEHVPPLYCRVLALYRDGHYMTPKNWISMEVGDEVFIAVQSQHLEALVALLNPEYTRYERIMIYGGEKAGFSLAHSLQEHYRVKLVEPNPAVCQKIRPLLHNTTVIQGTPSNLRLLKDENIEYTDLFCATTADDENNVMTCINAASLGAKKTLSIVQNLSYYDMITRYRLPVDTPISTQVSSFNSILMLLYKNSNVRRIYAVRDTNSELIEVMIGENSPLVGRMIKDIRLPYSASIGALSRRHEEGARQVIIPSDHTTIHQNDRLVCFLPRFSERTQFLQFLFQGG